MPFQLSRFHAGKPLGRFCYSQVELTEWYKNVNWNNGYNRQNTNGGRGFKTFVVKNQDGKPIKVNPMARYSAGKTFINCIGGPSGQYSDGLNDFQVRDWIQEQNCISLSEYQKVKMRLNNSPDVRIKGLKQPDRYLEVYETDKDATN
jgi:hypothetical protein